MSGPVAVRISETLRCEVRDWLYHEAQLLDDGEFRAWLELVTEDVRYTIPVRVSRERAAGIGVIREMAHMDENYDSLEMRTLRIETEHCWAEDPPSRTRHFVTNIRVSEGAGGEVHVRSNVLLYRTRGGAPTQDLISAERRDVLVRNENGQLRLREREVILDQSTVLTHNIAVLI